jgi:hypothetical protein
MTDNLQRLKQLTDELFDRDFFLKKKQQMLEMLLSTAPVPAFIWILDQELRFVKNEGRLSCLADVTQYEGTSIYEYFETSDPDQSPIKEAHQALEGETVSFRMTTNGKHFWCQCAPLRDYEERIIGVMGISWDFTDMKEICTSNCPYGPSSKGEVAK